jgi:hypothetical protein
MICTPSASSQASRKNHLPELAELHPGAVVDELLQRRVGLVDVRRRHHAVTGAAGALGEEQREPSTAGDEADGGHR